MEKAAWYNNDFGMKMSKQMAKEASNKQGKLMNPEDIYDIDDCDHTYTTLNERPGTYDGSPGAARLNLGRPGQEQPEVELKEDSDDERSEVSNLTNISNYSKRDLYDKLKELEIGNPQKSSRKGSAPKDNSKPQQYTLEDEERASDNDSSSLSSTSSEEDTSRAAAAPSG